VTSLHRQISDWAVRDPNRLAIVDGHRRISYGQLDAAANQLARRLNAAGAGPETLVGVCADRSAELVLALVAVARSGAAYLPLDPSFPPARRQLLLEDSRCRLLLAQDHYIGELAHDGVAVVPLHPWSAEGSGIAGESEAGETTLPEATAYVMYTSGSTGVPKGVVVTRHNVERLFTGLRGVLDFGPSDTWTLFHSYAFDFAVWEMWGALAHGGRLVVVSESVARSPELLLQLVIDESVTVLSQTPSAFRHFAEAARQAGHPRTALRLVIFGGEQLVPTTLRAWVDSYGYVHPRLVNMYGITETTVHVTYHQVQPADIDSTDSPIGRPLPDLRVRLFDEQFRAVAVGEVGEIVVSGAGVARGYLNRPELTRERFVVDPDKPETRMYRSGDLAQARPDGTLIFRGRADQQVKVRGFRVELGEIDAAVRRDTRVRGCATVAVTDARSQTRLVCYVVAGAGAGGANDMADTELVDTLRARLRGELPQHMWPSAFEIVKSLPLTPNGKLDRTALGERTASRFKWEQNPTIDPGAPTVERLLAVLRRVLGREDVTPSDDFFGLGGDSMLAVSAVGEAKAAGVDISVADLFAHPKVADIAAVHDKRAEPASSVPPLPGLELDPEDRAALPTDVERAYPMSSLQSGMIFLAALNEDPTLNHDLVSVHLSGTLTDGALAKALRRLVARHETLRTSFDVSNYLDQLALVHRDVNVPLEVIADAPDVRAWWPGRWQSGFDLEHVPLLRCHVLVHKPEYFTLALSAHHAILDGWSFAVLISDLIRDYDAALAGPHNELASLPGLELQGCAHFVALERAIAASDEAKRYWMELLAGADPLPLPTSATTARKPDLDPQVRQPIPPHLVTAVADLTHSWQVPAKSVYQAVQMAALSDLTNRADVTCGIVMNGRPEIANSDSMLGLFLNSVPLRAFIDESTSPRELVGAVAAQELRHQPYRRYPISQIQRDLGAAPFDVLFNFTSFAPFDALRDLRQIKVSDWWFCDRTNFAVTAELGREPMSPRWSLSVRIDPAQVAPPFAAALSESFLARLEWMCGA
jgi:amino acid adenylation domain-containing protein